MTAIAPTVKGSKLTIPAIDLDDERGPSGSGKTVIIASTGGNMEIPTPNGPVFLGLNLYRYPAK